MKMSLIQVHMQRKALVLVTPHNYLITQTVIQQEGELKCKPQGPNTRNVNMQPGKQHVTDVSRQCHMTLKYGCGKLHDLTLKAIYALVSGASNYTALHDKKNNVS